MIYIVEHLEPRLYKWCWLEYQHISQIVGKENLWFTNIRTKAQRQKLALIGRVFSQPVPQLSLPKVCVLDPTASKTLSPTDALKIDFLVFGGILGDYPPRERTKEELTILMSNPLVRNLGKVQLPTDNAVYLAKEILAGKTISQMQFSDNIEINFAKGLSMQLPFRYVLLKGKPLISPKLMEFLKKKKGF